MAELGIEDGRFITTYVLNFSRKKRTPCNGGNEVNQPENEDFQFLPVA